MKRLSFILVICVLLLFSLSLYADNNTVVPNIDLNKATSYYKTSFNAEQIKILQNRLNELGYDCGIADGIAGKKTINALAKFQADKKIAVDGIPNNLTLETLGISKDVTNSATKSNTYLVKFKNSYLEYNNHVGNEWGTSVKVNGSDLKWDESVKVNLTNSNPIRIQVAATEFDKIPDSSSASKSITLKELEGKTKLLYKISTIVVENRGRYSGNTAKWVFEFEITKVE